MLGLLVASKQTLGTDVASPAVAREDSFFWGGERRGRCELGEQG